MNGASMHARQPKVSVIVPVYNEETMLPLCIDSLVNLDYPKDLTEIIFVDNNSTDSSAEIIRKYPVKYIFEKRRGRSVAKNTGVRAATGEIVAFTDADCVVSKEWLTKLMRGFRSERVACCGGRTLSYKPENIIERYFDWVAAKYTMDAGHFVTRYFIGHVFATCNLACNRSMVEEVGFFEEHIGPADDTDMVWKLNLKGYQFNYVADAVVWHKRRATIAELPEGFFIYSYWTYCLVRRYEKALRMKYYWSTLVYDLLNSIHNSIANIFTEKSLLHSINAMETLIKILSGLYGSIKVNVLKIRINKPLAFEPMKVIWRWDGSGGVMIYDSVTVTGYELKDSAARVWELLDKDYDENSIVDIICKEYLVNKEDAEKDVRELIEGLAAEGILPAMCKMEKGAGYGKQGTEKSLQKAGV